MGYVESNLVRNEDVIYRAAVHWIVFTPGILIFITGVSLSVAGADSGAAAFGGFFILIAFASLLRALITRSTTEFVVTSKRVISKVGLVWRQTEELNLTKVESFNVSQSLLGRIFGYGTVVVSGTGSGQVFVSSIENPMEFRKIAMRLVDKE